MSILVNSEGLLGRGCFCWDHPHLESISGWCVQQDLRSEGPKMHFFFLLPPEVQRDEHSFSSKSRGWWAKSVRKELMVTGTALVSLSLLSSYTHCSLSFTSLSFTPSSSLHTTLSGLSHMIHGLPTMPPSSSTLALCKTCCEVLPASEHFWALTTGALRLFLLNVSLPCCQGAPSEPDTILFRVATHLWAYIRIHKYPSRWLHLTTLLSRQLQNFSLWRIRVRRSTRCATVNQTAD